MLMLPPCLRTKNFGNVFKTNYSLSSDGAKPSQSMYHINFIKHPSGVAFYKRVCICVCVGVEGGGGGEVEVLFRA